MEYNTPLPGDTGEKTSDQNKSASTVNKKKSAFQFLREMVAGYYWLLLIGSACIVLLVTIMRFV